MTETTFRLIDHAEDFVTRDLGKRLRELLIAQEAESPGESRITIDATGVSIMTPSFVDEFFGRTVARLGIDRFRTRFRIIGVENETRLLINNVVRNRLILEQRSAAR